MKNLKTTKENLIIGKQFIFIDNTTCNGVKSTDKLVIEITKVSNASVWLHTISSESEEIDFGAINKNTFLKQLGLYTHSRFQESI